MKIAFSPFFLIEIIQNTARPAPMPSLGCQGLDERGSWWVGRSTSRWSVDRIQVVRGWIIILVNI